MNNLGSDAMQTDQRVTDGFLAALEPARARFRGMIVQRILAFEDLRKGVEQGHDAVGALANIAGLAHKISGVGATLGFVQAGDLATALERIIIEGRSRRATPYDIWADAEPGLDALLDALEALLDD